MKTKIAALLTVTMLVAGCSSKSDQATDAAAPAQLTVFEFMTEKVDKDADIIWEIGNKAIDDQAAIDPALMSDEDWTRLGKSATQMAADSRALAAVEHIVVRPVDKRIADEGTAGAPTVEQIEGHIDRDHDLFRSLAESLANHADELASTAARKDHVVAARLINELDGVCESCHLEFWYPEQKELIERMGIATH